MVRPTKLVLSGSAYTSESWRDHSGRSAATGGARASRLPQAERPDLPDTLTEYAASCRGASQLQVNLAVQKHLGLALMVAGWSGGFGGLVGILQDVFENGHGAGQSIPSTEHRTGPDQTLVDEIPHCPNFRSWGTLPKDRYPKDPWQARCTRSSSEPCPI